MTQQQQSDGSGLTRRETLSLLAGLPVALLGLPRAADLAAAPIAPEEALPLYTTGLPAAWKLYFSGGMKEVEHLLPNYLSDLRALVRQSSPHQNQAAHLATQTCLLASLILVQHEDFKKALTFCSEASDYAELADDSNLKAAVLLRRGWIHWYRKRPSQKLLADQEAMHYVNQISPGLQGMLYAHLGETYAQLGQEREALRFTKLAADTFPEYPEADPTFGYTYYDSFGFTRNQGLAYLHLGQPRKAWEIFSHLDSIVPISLVPCRVQLLGHQAQTAVALGDMELSCERLEAAVQAALDTGNEVRYSEAYDIYQRMETRWEGERRVKALRGLFKQ